MNFKKVIAAFLLTILVSTFSFTYFSVPPNQFIEINEEENRHSGNSITFSMQEYLIDDTKESLFILFSEMHIFSNNFIFLTFAQKVVSPPPEFI